MDIGTGIAIAGVWLMVGCVAISTTTTGAFLWIATIIAIAVTVFLK